MNDQIDPQAALRKKIARLSRLPGVYLMKGSDGEVIYVGKAKDLRARVRTYFAGGDGRYQIAYLMARVDQVDTIVTKTEEQAIVLERDLISKYKPRFNIKLKDDKAYLSIRIDENAPWPRIELVRKISQDGARYLGPFAWSNELRGLLEAIKKIVPLRSCADTVFYNRQRPCLEYQIRRCAGPCCLPVDRDQYGEWVTQAINILEGKTRQTLIRLRELMEAASEDLRFEEAAAWRDRMEILESYEAGHNLISRRAEDRDVIGFWREGQQASVCMLFVRYGRISDSKIFSFGDLFLDNEELLSSVIEQFYRDDQVVPPEILLPIELQNASLVAAALKIRSGHPVELATPQRGSKMRLVEIANLNARQHFLGHLAVDAAWSSLSAEIAQKFSLSQAPRKVECVDISNFQGSDIVGAVVSFFDGAPEKTGYRNYEISFQEKPDDFRAVHEVVTRRLTRGLERADLPDLLVIDGGRGQLGMALRAREEVGAQIDIISIAKMRTESDVRAAELKRKPERIYLSPTTDPIDLVEGDRVTGFFQRLRDETHRFVISRHRERRGRRAVRSVLDGLPGITPERRRRLLVHFGSVEKLGSAEIEEIARVGRMPKGLAEKVLRALRAG